MSSRLSDELRKKYKKKSVPVRKGDDVIIMRGSFKGVKGKVDSIIRRNYSVLIDNVYTEKKNGTKVKVPVDASKLMITGLNNSDKRIGGASQ
jgi:ribosomal protein uL24